MWWVQGIGPAPPAVLGVYSEPPPPEATYVNSYRVGDSRAAAAAAWVTHRLNDAASVLRYLPIPWE